MLDAAAAHSDRSVIIEALKLGTRNGFEDAKYKIQKAGDPTNKTRSYFTAPEEVFDLLAISDPWPTRSCVPEVHFNGRSDLGFTGPAFSGSASGGFSMIGVMQGYVTSARLRFWKRARCTASNRESRYFPRLCPD